jgi:hypothetical protein
MKDGQFESKAEAVGEGLKAIGCLIMCIIGIVLIVGFVLMVIFG